MGKVVLDAELRAKLGGGADTVRLTDEAGNVVGSYLPQAAFDRIASQLLRPSSREELDEARKEMLAHGGVSGTELQARLTEIQRQWEARQ